jgi:hypothetical protein
MHRHEMQQSNIYLGIEYYRILFLLENQGVTADCYRGSASRVAMARAYAQNREDPNGGLHLYLGLGQGVGPSIPPRRGPGRGRCTKGDKWAKVRRGDILDEVCHTPF